VSDRRLRAVARSARGRLETKGPYVSSPWRLLFPFTGTPIRGAMNAGEAADVVALLDRINELLREFKRSQSGERQAAIKAELEEATDRLQRIALSFQN